MARAHGLADAENLPSTLRPFDRLTAQGERKVSSNRCYFFVHAEPFDSPFVLGHSKDERLAQDRLVEAWKILFSNLLICLRGEWMWKI